MFDLKYFEKLDGRYQRGETLVFRDDGLISSRGITHKFAVLNGYNGVLLGYVKYYTPWRQFTFFPLNATIYDKKCMRELADFCEKTTQEQRDKSNQRRVEKAARTREKNRRAYRDSFDLKKDDLKEEEKEKQ